MLVLSSKRFWHRGVKPELIFPPVSSKIICKYLEKCIKWKVCDFSVFLCVRVIEGLITDAFRATRVQWTVGFLEQKGKRRESVFSLSKLWGGHVNWVSLVWICFLMDKYILANRLQICGLSAVWSLFAWWCWFCRGVCLLSGKKERWEKQWRAKS